METKKIYDLRINSHGKADPMNYGFFEKTHALSMNASQPLNLVEIVGANGVTYRVDPRDAESEPVKRFFKALERKFAARKEP